MILKQPDEQYTIVLALLKFMTLYCPDAKMAKSKYDSQFIMAQTQGKEREF